jgi:hypothetical protein
VRRWSGPSTSATTASEINVSDIQLVEAEQPQFRYNLQASFPEPTGWIEFLGYLIVYQGVAYICASLGAALGLDERLGV